MDVETARRLLGVAPGDAWEVVREHYRSRIRRAHPDVAGGDAAAATQLNLAMAVLLRHRDRSSAAPPGAGETTPAARPPAARTGAEAAATGTAGVQLLGDDTLVLDDPPGAAFPRLLAGLDRIGEVTHVDRSGPVVGAVVVLEDGTSHSLVLSLRGRGASTEAAASLEALETVRSGRPAAVLRTLARFIPPRSP